MELGCDINQHKTLFAKITLLSIQFNQTEVAEAFATFFTIPVNVSLH